MCVSVYACVLFTCPGQCRSRGLMFETSCSLASPCLSVGCVRQGLSPNLGLTISARLATSEPRILLPPPVPPVILLQVCATPLALPRCWDPNSEPHLCTASMLPTEPQVIFKNSLLMFTLNAAPLKADFIARGYTRHIFVL